MNRSTFLMLPAVLATRMLAQNKVPPPKTHLKVGDKAPDFTLPSTTGDPITLSDYLGKNTVVVGFFPAAFTGG